MNYREAYNIVSNRTDLKDEERSEIVETMKRLVREQKYGDFMTLYSFFQMGNVNTLFKVHAELGDHLTKAFSSLNKDELAEAVAPSGAVVATVRITTDENGAEIYSVEEER